MKLLLVRVPVPGGGMVIPFQARGGLQLQPPLHSGEGLRQARPPLSRTTMPCSCALGQSLLSQPSAARRGATGVVQFLALGCWPRFQTAVQRRRWRGVARLTRWSIRVRRRWVVEGPAKAWTTVGASCTMWTRPGTCRLRSAEPPKASKMEAEHRVGTGAWVHTAQTLILIIHWGSWSLQQLMWDSVRQQTQTLAPLR